MTIDTKAIRRACALALILLTGTLLRAQELPDDGGQAPRLRNEDQVMDLVAELSNLRDRIADKREQLIRNRPDDLALAQLKLEKARIVLASPWRTVGSEALLIDDLQQAREIWKALAAGEPVELRRHGKLERAYLAPNDLSPQPYLLYVPEDHDPAEPRGLFVFLHGYAASLNKANWTEMMYTDAMGEVAAETGCILLMPFARGNTDFQGVGEDDVLLAIEQVQQDYKIDTDRIFLGGISMGGMGAWSIGAHYPDKFAGLAVLAGRSDFYIWKDVQRGALPQWKRKLVRGEFGAELIPNYRHLPSVIVHGTADWIMPMKQSRRMARLLGEAGFPTRMVELEGATHGSWTEMLTAPPVIAGLKEWQREEAPERVTFRTWTTKYDGAYWVRLTGLQSWAEEVEIDASCEPEARTIEVETRNVTGLRLQRPSGPWPAGGDVQVIWNGHAHAVEPDEAGYVTVGRGPPAEGLWKRRGLCGPIREAFADRFVFVYGGEKGGPSYQRTIVAATDWLRFARGMPDIMSAERVTPELMKEANLILYGTPEDNPIMAEVAPKLPVRIEAGEYVVGERRYEASKFGFSVVYPNPLASERYVVVNSGPVWGKGLAGNHKYDMLPDFIVFTEGVLDDGTESNTAVAAGFFDQEWQFDPDSTWFMEDDIQLPDVNTQEAQSPPGTLDSGREPAPAP